MHRHTILLPVLLAAAIPAGKAIAEDVTVECKSHDYQYNECYAPLDAPQLVYQSSRAACVINRTWGFNPNTSRIWVTEGCAGVFADPGGYHHGESGTADSGARQYGHRGHDAGAVVAGAILGALIEDAASGNKRHTTTNNYIHTGRTGTGYTGCHGTGCLVDNPDYSSDVSSPPEPGQTSYSSSYSYDDPPEPGQTGYSSSYSYDDPPEPGQSTFSDDSPPEPGQTEMSEDD